MVAWSIPKNLQSELIVMLRASMTLYQKGDGDTHGPW